MAECSNRSALVGLGFREQLRADIFLNRGDIDVLEITTDHYIDASKSKSDELKILKDHFVLLPHCLDLSLGSAEGIDGEYLEKVANVVEKVDPPWFSDHFCFTRSGGHKIGHLAPIPFTREAVDVFVGNIASVRKRIRTPLLLENIAYLVRFPFGEMSEAEFITRVCEESDCGLLLDVTNLYVNSVNFDFDWREFLDAIPLERVRQIHFVGYRKHGKRLIDAHSDETGDEVWQVFEEALRRCPVEAAILERDDNFPDFAELVGEIRTARGYIDSVERSDSVSG